MRIYAVAATRNVKKENGWSSSHPLPMFYLHAGTQGILSEKHASQLASEIVGEDATAYDVTSDMPESARLIADAPRLAEENARLRALLETILATADSGKETGHAAAEAVAGNWDVLAPQIRAALAQDGAK